MSKPPPTMSTTMPTAIMLSMERLSRMERMLPCVRKTGEAKIMKTNTATTMRKMTNSLCRVSLRKKFIRRTPWIC